MSMSSADSPLSITSSPLTGVRNDEASNGAASRPEVVTHSGLRDTPSAPAHSAEPDATALPPKETIAKSLAASVRPRAARLFQGPLWGRKWSIKTLIATSWSHWRNEIEVRRTTRALAGFDDRTLRKLGIRDRSQIELTVRFCREC